MDAIQRIEFRFRGVKKSHAAGVAGIIDQIIKFIGAQLRQRALKSANKCVKGVDFAGAERQRDRPGAQCFNPCNHLVRLGKTRFVGQYYIYAALCQRWGQTPAVILVTAERDATLRRQAAERGWGFLAKPVRAPALRALMSQTLLRLGESNRK